MKDSQDLSKQTEKLKTQIQSQEQELHSLQVATKSARKQWDDQKKQIAKDTEVTIEASRRAIKDATKVHQTKLEGLKRTIPALQQAKAAYEDETVALVKEREETLNDLEHEKNVLQRTNNDLSIDNRDLMSEITVNRLEMQKLVADGLVASEQLAIFKADELVLTESLQTLSAEQAEKIDELANFETISADKITELEKSVSILEAKKLDLEQQIIQNRAQDEKVRENLADWDNKLTERDKNLRIREARVNEQEKAVARNYNLLNL